MLNVKAFDPARSALMCAMTYVNILPHVWWVTVMSKCSHIMLKKKFAHLFALMFLVPEKNRIKTGATFQHSITHRALHTHVDFYSFYFRYNTCTHTHTHLHNISAVI